MYTFFEVVLFVVWPAAFIGTCLLVRGGAIHERELRQLEEAQRNIQRALAH